MLQIILPLIPHGATPINSVVSVWRDDDRWAYFHGTHPIYSHKADDRRMFRLATSQLIDAGACKNRGRLGKGSGTGLGVTGSWALCTAHPESSTTRTGTDAHTGLALVLIMGPPFPQ